MHCEKTEGFKAVSLTLSSDKFFSCQLGEYMQNLAQVKTLPKMQHKMQNAVYTGMFIL